jgi:hypothetical protein
MPELHDEARLGSQAKELLENPLFDEAFQSVEDIILQQQRSIDLGDTAQHSQLVLAYQLLHLVKRALVQFVETGSLAESQLAELTRK